MNKAIYLFLLLLIGCGKVSPAPNPPRKPHHADCYSIMEKTSETVGRTDYYRFHSETATMLVSGEDYIRYKIGDVYCPK